MTTTSQLSGSTLPGLPATQTESLYLINFLEKNHKPAVKIFRFAGPMPNAIDRARKHCEIINRRFISVVPFVADLDAEEKRFQEFEQS